LSTFVARKAFHVGFADAVKSCLSKYATFSGRSRRSEYWWFYLFYTLVVIAGVIIDAVLGTDPILYVLTALGLFVPTLAAAIRRLHDIDKSGWWYLVGFIPLVGFIILIVWGCKDGTRGPNRFGADPKGGTDQLGYQAGTAVS